MTYIRLDYAVTFFTIFVIISMVREIYKDYKFKMKPTDYDSGYRQAVKDIANKWNELYGTFEVYTFVMEMKNYIQNELKSR